MKFKTFTLSNNVPVITINEADLPSITCLVLVKVGSRYETDLKAGLAHFVEHMVFKGTKAYKDSQELTLTIESLGAEINAFTSYEYTGYYIKVPKDNFEKALEVLSQIFINSSLPDKEIKKEAAVIVEEIKMYQDMPTEKVKNNFFANIFPEHPLGRDIAGSAKTVMGLEREDLKTFINQNYVAENTIIAVSGSFTEATITKILEKRFSKIKSGKSAISAKFTKNKTINKVIWEEKPIEQEHIVIGGFSYPKDSPLKYALQAGNSILSFGMGSMLHQEIREKHGLAYYVSMGNRGLQEVGAYVATMGVDPQNTQKAITAFLGVLRRFLDGKFSDRELERGKNYLIGSIIHELETGEDLAEWYGLQYLLNGRLETQEQVIEKIKSLSKAEIIAAWEPILKPENMLISLLGPLPRQEIKISL